MSTTQAESKAAEVRPAKKLNKYQAMLVQLWHVAPDDTTFTIKRTPKGWTGQIVVPSGPVIERYAHTPADVLGMLAREALRAARGQPVRERLDGAPHWNNPTEAERVQLERDVARLKWVSDRRAKEAP